MSFYMRSPVYTPNDPVKSVKQLHSWLFQLNENLKYMFSNLDSDNFTSEFAASFSQESAQKTQDEIKKLDEALNALSEKAAWQPIALNGLTDLSEATAPAYLCLTDHVYFSGKAALASALSGNETRVLASLPSRCIPRKNQECMCFAGSFPVFIKIHVNGSLSLVNPSGNAIGENTIVSFSFSYGL